MIQWFFYLFPFIFVQFGVHSAANLAVNILTDLHLETSGSTKTKALTGTVAQDLRQRRLWWCMDFESSDPWKLRVSGSHTFPHGRWVVLLGSCDPPWPTAIFSANSLPSNIHCTDMLCGSQVHRTRISLCKLATLVSYAAANFIVFSTPCFQQTIHPTSTACQIVMNHSFPTFRITLTEVLLLAIIIVRPGSP